MDRKLAEPKSQYGRYEEKKNFARTRNWTPAVQHLAHQYTDWASQLRLNDTREITIRLSNHIIIWKNGKM
jgi:hypothetical protein